jgi:hypothetical protein
MPVLFGASSIFYSSDMVQNGVSGSPKNIVVHCLYNINIDGTEHALVPPRMDSGVATEQHFAYAGAPTDFFGSR